MRDTAGMKNAVDYTTAPAGLRVTGKLWTGEPTTFTEKCPKCGRVGVGSMRHGARLIIVHTGYADGNILEGVDYCTHLIH